MFAVCVSESGGEMSLFQSGMAILKTAALYRQASHQQLDSHQASAQQFITMVVDEMLKSIATIPGSRQGVQHEVANGVLVDREGEKKVLVESDEGVAKGLTVQVTGVNKALLSVS